MKRFLFTTIPEKGHINPMIGPAVHLQRAGHDVAFYAAHDISCQVGRAGLSVVPGLPSAPPPLDGSRGEMFARQVRDTAWLRQWIKSLLIDAAEAQIEPIRTAIRAYAPDVVVTDPMIYAAAIASEKERVPWMAISNSLNPILDETVSSDLLETVRWLSPDRDALFARHGMALRFSGCDMISPRLTVAFTTAEFVGHQRDGVQIVGPSIPPAVRGDEVEFSWDQLSKDRPLLYVSFGSQVYHQPEIFRLIIDATRDLEVQVLIAANRLHGTSKLGPLPPHVLTCHYAPQLQLLPRATAFVTHGGANSVMEALYFGVPMLISPVCNDQFHQAHYLQKSDAGRVLDLHRATVKECHAALEAILYDDTIREAARRISSSYQKDGAAIAAELIASRA